MSATPIPTEDEPQTQVRAEADGPGFSSHRSAQSIPDSRTGLSSRMQFGCGLCAPPDWRNFDAGPAFWLQKKLPFLTGALIRRGYPRYPRNVEYGNIIEGLPIASGTLEAVYCSHVLEHLALDEFQVTIRNVFSYLLPGGIFRMVLPDLEYLAKAYVADPGSEAASRFMVNGCLGVRRQPRGFSGALRLGFGRSRHLWMWDYKGIAQELAGAGFVQIRRAWIGDSSDPHFAAVEDPGRWENCLGVECRRPERY